MASQGGGEVRNEISGGTQHGPVVQGRDFEYVHIGDIVQTPTAPIALAQLPALLTGFTGRKSELAQICALLDPAGDSGPVVVSAVAGLAGVGKTSLAVQAAHAACQAGWFQGGVLFIDLHGYDNAPVEPGQALDSLLRALGLAAEHIPSDTGARAGLYRSELARRGDPVLIIADNASSEAQVRLLLPGPGSHRVMVTSRHTLAGLGARLLDVTVLDDDAGVALLDEALRIARTDDDRILTNQPAARCLTRICGGLPLALQIIAAILIADPFRTVSDLADDLADEIRRLDALQYDDGSGTNAPSVAAAFELSYRQLGDVAARVFRLLPVNPGPDISTSATAVLARLPASEARKVIGLLLRAHMVEAAAGATGRWRMHDLLRLYAGQLSDADAYGREEARDRLLTFYMEMADAADTHLRPERPMSTEFSSAAGALAWLDAERRNLVAAVTMAAKNGRHEIAIFLSNRLAQYFDLRRRFDDKVATTLVGFESARRLGDKENESGALGILGGTLPELGRFDEAIAACQGAIGISQEINDRYGEGMATGNLGRTLRSMRRFEEAITAFQETVVIFREIGERHGEGNAMDNLGTTLWKADRVEEAITAFQDAKTIYQKIGDRYGEGVCLSNLGSSLHEVGRFEEAITACRSAVVIFRESGYWYGEGVTMSYLGEALLKAGRSEEAITAYEDAAAIFRDAGNQDEENEVLQKVEQIRASRQA